MLSRVADFYARIGEKDRSLKVLERLAQMGGGGDPQAEDLITIGADTIVVVNRKVLGKPRDTDDAARMLALLSGREHTVITAVAVSRGRKLRSAVEEVRVRFRRLRDDEIEAYIATGEPMDKAGAYGIQGYGATIVERIEGDYFAVMGLPVVRLIGLLRDVGVRYRFGSIAKTET